MVVVKPGNVNVISLKLLIDVLKEVKFTKSTNTTGKLPKNANDANVKKNWSLVKSRLFPDVMLNKLVKNSPKFHQLVLPTDTHLTTNFHNALFTETSHGNVVPDESGLVTKRLKVVKMLAVLNAPLVHELLIHFADQMKTKFKNSIQIQSMKNVHHVLNFLANVTLNSAMNLLLAKKITLQFTVLMKINVAKFCWNASHQATNVPEKSVMDIGSILSLLTLVMFTKKATANLALVTKATLGFATMNEILAQIFQNALMMNI
jgi:hypothetical protein